MNFKFKQENSLGKASKQIMYVLCMFNQFNDYE